MREVSQEARATYKGWYVIWEEISCLESGFPTFLTTKKGQLTHKEASVEQEEWKNKYIEGRPCKNLGKEIPDTGALWPVKNGNIQVQVGSILSRYSNLLIFPSFIIINIPMSLPLQETPKGTSPGILSSAQTVWAIVLSWCEYFVVFQPIFPNSGASQPFSRSVPLLWQHSEEPTKSC